MTFDDFIDSLGLRFFAPDEFLVATDRELNTPPPIGLWQNIVMTALVLDTLRERIGHPVVISSCYRAPAYNRSIGGVVRSQHQAFVATDFVVSRVPAQEIATELRSWRGDWIDVPFVPNRVRYTVPDVGLVPYCELEHRTLTMEGKADRLQVKFHGGVGEYFTFTHLDTRGLSADWKG